MSRDGEIVSHYDLSGDGLVLTDSHQFAPDGSRIYVRATYEDGTEGVWWIPTAGGRATKIVSFDDPSVAVGFDLTVGWDNLYLTVAQYESDIWVMDLDW